jgi:hypothetical protein
MRQFLQRFAPAIKGVLSGFDRLLFHGSFRRLSYSKGVNGFLMDHSIPLRDFANWCHDQTERVKAAFHTQAETDGHRVIYLPSPSVSKEDLARRQQEQRGITSGVIGSWSCVEPARTWVIRRVPGEAWAMPQAKQGQCLHLYRYFDHHRFGFGHIRLQTWFPFQIQVYLNGREYLRRRLDRTAITCQKVGNAFADIQDWSRAQRMFDDLLEVDWITELIRLAGRIFPDRPTVVGDLDYHWSVAQSEWATDLVFHDPAWLAKQWPTFLHHTLLTADSPRVLRFLGHSTRLDGQPHGNLRHEVTTRYLPRTEGACIRHTCDANSVKMYTKPPGILRVEATINHPKSIKVFRKPQGTPGKAAWRPLRKSVVDLKRRGQVCQAINQRYLDHQATVRDDTKLGDLVATVTKPIVRDGERHRALDLIGKDRGVLCLLVDPVNTVHGMTNRDMQNALKTSGKTARQRSAMATRRIRLLRAHHIIAKVPRSNRYHLTERGRALVTATVAALAATQRQLSQLAA